MCTSSTAQSPNAPAIITTTTTTTRTSNSLASSGVASGIVSGRTATESCTPWEDMNYVQVMAVPDAVHCSEDLPEESETMRLTQEKTVAVQKVDGPSLIGTDSSHDVTCQIGFTRGASVESNTSHNQSTSGGSVGRRLLRSIPTHSPRGQRSSGERSTTNEELLHQQPITIGTDPPTEDSSSVATVTQMTSSVSTIESGDSSSTAGAVESLDGQADGVELAIGSPRKQQRRAAAKPGRKTTTRQRTANSKRKL